MIGFSLKIMKILKIQMGKYIVLILLVVIGCDFNSTSSRVFEDNFLEVEYSQDFDNLLGLVSIDEIKFQIDSNTSYKSNNLRYFEDLNDSYLIAENNNLNSIDFYSFTTKSIVKRLSYPKEGPNSINISGFIIHNLDSIFLLPKYSLDGVILTDTTGAVKKIYHLKSDEKIINHATKTRIPSYYVDGKIYSLVIPNQDFSDPSFFELENGLEFEFDLKKETGRYLPIKYPSSYIGHTWGVTHAIPCRIYNTESNTFFYSYGIDEFLYTYSISGEPKMKIYAGSNYINNIEPLDDRSARKNANLNYLLDQPYYGDLFYDKYRKVYYRFCKLPIKREERIWENKPVSIVILDQDLNKIGETLLEPLTGYYPRDIFITKEGLYVSNNHPLNDKLEEDRMSFTKLVLSNISEDTLSSMNSGMTNEVSINWLSFKDLSKPSDRNILVYLYTDWCKGCKTIEKEYLEKTQVVDFLNNEVYAVKFNGDSYESININNKVYGRIGMKHQIVDSLVKPPAYPGIILLDKNLVFIDDYIPPEYPSYKRRKNYLQEFLNEIRNRLESNEGV